MIDQKGQKEIIFFKVKKKLKKFCYVIQILVDPQLNNYTFILFVRLFNFIRFFKYK